MAAPTRDQRRYARKPVEVEFTVHDERGKAEAYFDSKDLSLGGAFLKSDLFFELGETVAFDLRLHDGTPLRVQGRVVWVKRDEDRNNPFWAPGMGIEFTELSDGDRTRIRRYLESL